MVENMDNSERSCTNAGMSVDSEIEIIETVGARASDQLISMTSSRTTVIDNVKADVAALVKVSNMVEN